jgi:exodeoxyribonuclease-3
VKIATWNVNGVRAREAQLVDWIAREQPDVIGLQELKATREQVPASLSGLADYWSCWHGERA